MPRPPDCLLGLLRGTPSQRGCTLFLISFNFMCLVSVMIYWHIAGEPGSPAQLSNLPVDIPCPHLEPPRRPSGTPPPGNIFFLETSDRTNPNFLFMCSVESAARLSDAARLALMWKFGGIYLDTDFIVLKNLGNLTNTLGTQSRYVLNGAFLAFERHHEFVALCMRDFVAHYNGWIWGHQGPQLLTRVFKKWCSIRSLGESHACRGVRALPCEAFYPIPWQDWKKYFEEISPEELPRLLNATYAVHVWNKKSQGTRLEATSRALLAQLHSRYCPTTHEAMKMYL
ncbi:PREDICTED: lactosylceramide 4-alpha-galactosyltransferase [Myotis brandtii]|uniref:lactosylceramide 4-alpha-galactosyltransferase n=1 Tax=Myotis brandtii TaxID=109478 RepID=UPI0003BBE84C|nr:PREDICTED: lactosylceramide 4-alpha-galactosyltransferase [Myotis brandtii]